MEITWIGRGCFRLRGREGAVVTDPCPPDSGYRSGKLSAEVVTLSHSDNPDYAHRQSVPKSAIVLDAPGEYEIGGILIRGIAVRDPDGGRNIIFVSELDGVRIAHLGLLREVPTNSLITELENIDVLLLPVGGHNALGSAAAQDLMTSLAPSIAIPMNYGTAAETLPLEPLDRFLREVGASPEPEPRLTVTRSNLPEEFALHVLTPRE